jgi:hypothetical protein
MAASEPDIATRTKGIPKPQAEQRAKKVGLEQITPSPDEIGELWEACVVELGRVDKTLSLTASL